MSQTVRPNTLYVSQIPSNPHTFKQVFSTSLENQIILKSLLFFKIAILKIIVKG
jgi:hypothetical protein